jgi:hypothetical protein
MDHQNTQTAKGNTDPENVCDQIGAKKFSAREKQSDKTKKQSQDTDDQRSGAEGIQFGAEADV